MSGSGHNVPGAGLDDPAALARAVDQLVAAQRLPTSLHGMYSKYGSRIVAEWLLQNPAAPLYRQQVHTAYAQAYPQGATNATAVVGAAITGLAQGVTSVVTAANQAYQHVAAHPHQAAILSQQRAVITGYPGSKSSKGAAAGYSVQVQGGMQGQVDALHQQQLAQRQLAAQRAAQAADEQEDHEGEGDDDELDQSIVYTQYKPAKVHEGMDHPDPIVESQSLAGMAPPDPDYQHHLQDDVAAGRLSNAQLETVIYAMMRFKMEFSSGDRAGFFLGDGAGVGKGRQIAAVIKEFWKTHPHLAGQRRVLWVSTSRDLAYDARRDLRDLQMDRDIQVFPKGKDNVPSGSLAKPFPEGVLFLTYSLLTVKGRGANKMAKALAEISNSDDEKPDADVAAYGGYDYQQAAKKKKEAAARKRQRLKEESAKAKVAALSQQDSRLMQVVNWLKGEDGTGKDALIIFDECHRAKNLLDAAGNSTLTGLAVEALQEKLPKARVLYSSATGASEPQNLLYMKRVGTYGFDDMKTMVQELKKSGIGGVELFSMGLKATGTYLSRTLSYKDAEFRLEQLEIDPPFKVMYNRSTMFWSVLHQVLKQLPKPKVKGRDARAALFWSAHQRFYKCMLMASKVRRCAELAKNALDTNMCVVIGLQSTGEANMTAARELDGDEQEDLVSAPRMVMQQFVAKHLFRNVGAMDPLEERRLTAMVFQAYQMWKTLPKCDQEAVKILKEDDKAKKRREKAQAQQARQQELQAAQPQRGAGGAGPSRAGAPAAAAAASAGGGDSDDEIVMAAEKDLDEALEDRKQRAVLSGNFIDLTTGTLDTANVDRLMVELEQEEARSELLKEQTKFEEQERSLLAKLENLQKELAEAEAAQAAAVSGTPLTGNGASGSGQQGAGSSRLDDDLQDEDMTHVAGNKSAKDGMGGRKRSRAVMDDSDDSDSVLVLSEDSDGDIQPARPSKRRSSPGMNGSTPPSGKRHGKGKAQKAQQPSSESEVEEEPEGDEELSPEVQVVRRSRRAAAVAATERTRNVIQDDSDGQGQEEATSEDNSDGEDDGEQASPEKPAAKPGSKPVTALAAILARPSRRATRGSAKQSEKECEDDKENGGGSGQGQELRNRRLQRSNGAGVAVKSEPAASTETAKRANTVPALFAHAARSQQVTKTPGVVLLKEKMKISQKKQDIKAAADEVEALRAKWKARRKDLEKEAAQKLAALKKNQAQGAAGGSNAGPSGANGAAQGSAEELPAYRMTTKNMKPLSKKAAAGGVKKKAGKKAGGRGAGRGGRGAGRGRGRAAADAGSDDDSDEDYSAVDSDDDEEPGGSEAEEDVEDVLLDAREVVEVPDGLRKCRAVLLRIIEALELPPNPLDQLTELLGGEDKVAEMSGRKGMMIRNQAGKVEYKQRRDEDAQKMVNLMEKDDFMNGRKLVAIISDAASTGISLQADKRCQNQRRRFHITLELPWSADKAIQQFGRSHRSGQTSAPVYCLLVTKCGGEYRFAGAMAKRLASLGALLQGDQRAVGAAANLRAYDVETQWARRALNTIYDKIIEQSAPIPGVQVPRLPAKFFTPEDMAAAQGLVENVPVVVQQQTYYELMAQELSRVGLMKNKGQNWMGQQVWDMDPKFKTDVPRFLNRLLGLSLESQDLLFTFFSDTLSAVIRSAKSEGTFEEGVQVLRAVSVTTTEKKCIHTDTKTGAKSFLVRLRIDDGISWEDAREMKYAAQKTMRDSRLVDERQLAKTTFYIANNEWKAYKKPHVLLATQVAKTDDSRILRFRIVRPYQASSMVWQECNLTEKYRPVKDDREAEELWRWWHHTLLTNCLHGKNCHIKAEGGTCSMGSRVYEKLIVTGALLPVLHTLFRVLHTSPVGRDSHGKKAPVKGLRCRLAPQAGAGLHAPAALQGSSAPAALPSPGRAAGSAALPTTNPRVIKSVKKEKEVETIDLMDSDDDVMHSPVPPQRKALAAAAAAPKTTPGSARRRAGAAAGGGASSSAAPEGELLVGFNLLPRDMDLFLQELELGP